MPDARLASKRCQMPDSQIPHSQAKDARCQTRRRQTFYLLKRSSLWLQDQLTTHDSRLTTHDSQFTIHTLTIHNSHTHTLTIHNSQTDNSQLTEIILNPTHPLAQLPQLFAELWILG